MFDMQLATFFWQSLGLTLYLWVTVRALNFPSFLLISPRAPLFLSMLMLLRKAVGAFFIYMLFVSADILAIKHFFSHSAAQGREGSRCKLHSYILDKKPLAAKCRLVCC